MRAILLTLALILATAACEPPKKQPKEDTSDETVLQFHTVGQLRYGHWYEAPRSNSACRWRVFAKRAGGDDSQPTTISSGTGDNGLRVPEEKQGWDVFLRFNRACGQFQEMR